MSAGPARSLRIRRAAESDEALLLEWANDPITRKNAFSPTHIGPEEHHVWLRSRLDANERCHMFITETGEGIPVGQVRFDLGEAAWIIDYSISPAFRGFGFGRRSLELALGEMEKLVPGSKVVGHVKLKNVASRRIFDAIGFTSKGSTNAVEYGYSLRRPELEPP